MSTGRGFYRREEGIAAFDLDLIPARLMKASNRR